jgi:glycosyltransferase involved in cell wall biosynthesis
LLSQVFDVTALCFFRARERPSAEAVAASVAALREYGAVEAFPILQEHHRGRLLWDHFRSLVRHRAYTYYVYESRAYRRRLQEILQGHAFDLVHMDSLDLAGYLPLLQGLPVVCTHHNMESLLLRRRAAAEGAAWRRWYVGLQGELMERKERRWCDRVALNVAVSELDKELLTQLVPEARVAVAPNGVDTDCFRPGVGRDEGIVCVGGIGALANRDGLDHLCEDILPLLRRSVGDGLSVRWIGRATELERRRFREQHDVELTGYVEDVRPYVRDAACYVVPLRVGGGTRVKILDAWALGKAVVSTSIGCEGLHAKDGENILIRDTPTEFAAAVSEVLNNPELRRRLGHAARRLADPLYSWEAIGERMHAEYRSLLPSHLRDRCVGNSPSPADVAAS